MIFKSDRKVTGNEKSAIDSQDDVTNLLGWIYFAGIMMTVVGGFQIIAGLTGILRQSYYLVSEQSLIAFNYATWGWIHTVIGFVIFMAGIAVMSGSTWGRVVGIIIAALGTIASFAFMAAYPFWTIVIIIVNTLIIYALIVHGTEVRDQE